ncbi:hypothetical protein [Paenibacillus tyrfis]|uniref:hypothetical protein n=1 Tax=Paenibacillus tyrfis TaxID=1501230 RepID=UPI000B5921BF|nr:hypothetical protein [Paenibacillus tyrfis]
MFGRTKNEAPSVNPVPVYNVHTLQQSYQPIQMVWTKNSGGLEVPFNELIYALGCEGARIGADAVIGATFERNAVSKSVYMTGTAIKFTSR